MSGIFGVFNRDAKPVDKAIAHTLLDAISYWEPDERGLWHDGPVALGHSMLWNTPESRSEQLPNKQHSLIITLDARLDNRAELAVKLGMNDRSLTQITDSDFILAAYHQWAEQCPKYLLGDFAFAIWDERKQQLFCARDHIGIKPFYYHLTDSLFVFANDLKGLTKYSDISKEINDEAVANFIVNSQLINSTMTFFKEIQKLPPASLLTISATKVHRLCYWRLEDAPKIKLPDAKAYAKKLRELLKQAVYDRMRSAYPVTSHLSGGIDSSTIAVIAARKLREKGEKLLAFNWLHEPKEDDDSNHYEWSNSKTIAEAEGIEHHYVAITAEDIYHNMNNRTIVYGESAIFWYEYPVREASQKRGSRTILSGWGGDELSTYHGQSYYSDLFSQGKIIRVLKELKCIASQKSKSPMRRMLSHLYHNVILIYVPRNIYCHMPKNRCLQSPSFPFVKKEFLPAIQHEMKKTRVFTMQPPVRIREHMLAFWQNGHIQSRIESWASASIPNRLEYSYPLLDKRIIEFVLGMPPEYFVNNGVGRYIFRSAAEGLLPEKILWSNAKAEHNRVEQLASLFISACNLFTINEEISAEQSDYIDSDKLMQTLEKLKWTTLNQTLISSVMDIEASMSLMLSLRPEVMK